MDDDNEKVFIGQKLFEIQSKLNSIKSIQEKRKELLNKMKYRGETLEKKFKEDIFKNDTSEILELLDIDGLTKILLGFSINNVNIYKIGDITYNKLVIKYNYDDTIYEFVTKL